MITLRAKSIYLYLEGLMILTFDGPANLLEAAPLSQAGHRLEGVIHRRVLNKGGAPGKWRRLDYDPFEHYNIPDFATGRIFIHHGKAGSNADAALSSSCRTVDHEEWGTFGCIPDLKFFGQVVTLKHDMLKPSLRISTGTFYSVLIPRHPDAAAVPLIHESFIVNRDALQHLRKTTTTCTTENEITQGLVAARNSLGNRPYTAASILKLRQGQSLVCQLEKNGHAGSEDVLKIEYDSNYELRMAIQNFPILHTHESTEADDDPIHTFHSLHFYKAIKGTFPQYFLLSDESNQRRYVKKETTVPVTTGAGNPGCPIVWRLGKITI
jgi:hypothetical protein